MSWEYLSKIDPDELGGIHDIFSRILNHESIPMYIKENVVKLICKNDPSESELWPQGWGAYLPEPNLLWNIAPKDNETKQSLYKKAAEVLMFEEVTELGQRKAIIVANYIEKDKAAEMLCLYFYQSSADNPEPFLKSLESLKHDLELTKAYVDEVHSTLAKSDNYRKFLAKLVSIMSKERLPFGVIKLLQFAFESKLIPRGIDFENLLSFYHGLRNIGEKDLCYQLANQQILPKAKDQASMTSAFLSFISSLQMDRVKSEYTELVSSYKKMIEQEEFEQRMREGRLAELIENLKY